MPRTFASLISVTPHARTQFLEPERETGVKLEGSVPLTDEEIALLPLAGVKRRKRGDEL